MRSRSRYMSCSKNDRTCTCRSFTLSRIVRILSVFSERRASIHVSMRLSSTSERVYLTCSVETSLSMIFCSRSVSASRSHPRADFAMIFRASSSACIPSALQTYWSRVMISESPIFRKSNRSVRDRIVSGTFSISVVARMNFT